VADARIAFTITTDDAHEGGFQKNPNDHANWSSGQIGVGTLIGTKYGITPADLPGQDIENLTRDQAIDYYIGHYWKPLYSQISDQLTANKLADFGVLFGVGTAVKVLQTALGLIPDGAFGPATLAAVNQASPLAAYKAAMSNHALEVANANPAERVFLSDWLRRISS